MCYPPRLCVALLTTYVTLATALIDGSGGPGLPYLPINQRPPHSLADSKRHSPLEDLMASYNSPHIGLSDHLSSAMHTMPSQDLDDLAISVLSDKLPGSEMDGDTLMSPHNEGIDDLQRRARLEDVDFEELMDAMSREAELDVKNRHTRETYDFRKSDDPFEVSENLGEQGMLLVNCRSGRLDWPPCTLFSTVDTGPLHMGKEGIPHEEEYVEESQDSGEKQRNIAEGHTFVESEEDGGTRRKRETGMAEVNEISRSARQAGKDSFEPQSNVLPSKMRKGFSAWGGKRVPPFGSWGGKRAPDFHSWGGKRAQGGVKTLKKQPSAWEGKRMPAFHSWGGKRAPSFNSWGGKRAPSFNSWGGKRAPSFNSWGGKRAPSFNSWGGKRAPSFNSWGGKRAPSFNSWGGKRAPSFNSWGGKRAPAFTSWGGKREPFNSWGGKRAPFNSWGGKRAYEGGIVDENNEDISGHPTDINQLVSELENGELGSPGIADWAGPMPQFVKENSAAVVSKNKPPEK